MNEVPACSTRLARATANPVVVEVTRGDAVESRHRAAYAVVDVRGGVALAGGDTAHPVFPRSAVKPLQALALVETGAADAFELGGPEIALACASHAGEPAHVAVVESWLRRIGCSAADLGCGAHPPLDETAARALLSGGGAASPLHNNCSGKHAGFLTVARHLGHPTAGYADFAHPVQQRVLGILQAMTSVDDLSRAPRGIDGCGVPTFAVPLANLALSMARLGRPDDQPERRQAAAARVRRAMAAEPFLVAGSGRFCTRLLEVLGERAVLKSGAEGVFCCALPELALGLALKVDDGAGRAARVVMGALLGRLGVLNEAEAAALAEVLEPPVLNRAGRVVGRVRPAAGGLD